MNIKVNRLKMFLNREQEEFKTTKDKENALLSGKKEVFILWGDLGYFDMPTKMLSSMFSFIFLSFFGLVTFESNIVFLFSSFLSFLLYFLLSINTKESIRMAIDRKFLSKFFSDDKIKTIAEYLPEDIVSRLKEMIDDTGHAYMTYKELKRIIEKYEREDKKEYIFGGK